MTSCWPSGFIHTVQSVLTAESLTDFENPNEKKPPHSKWECAVAFLSSGFFPPSQLHFDRKLRGRATARHINPSSLNGSALAISNMHNKPTTLSVALLINANIYICCFYMSIMGLVNKRLRWCKWSRLVFLPVTVRKRWWDAISVG